MIKSWQQFNEAVKFEDSDEFKFINDKYAIKKENIQDILDDLSDEREVESKNPQTIIKKFDNNSISLLAWITFSKTYKNPKSFDTYHSFVKEQVEDMDFILKTCQRIEREEGFKIQGKSTDSLPFQGAGRNRAEFDYLTITIYFDKIIQTEEMGQAFKQFNQEDNPEKKAYVDVINKLVKMGIPKQHADKLVELNSNHEDMDHIIFGFISDDEIYEIATYYKDDKKLIFDETELMMAIDNYKRMAFHSPDAVQRLLL